MLHLVTQFSHQRSKKEALIFYGFFLLVSAILGFVLGLIFLSNNDIQTNNDNFLLMHFFVNPIYCALLALLVVLKKRTSTQYRFLLVILSAVLGYYGGTILGLLPIAYITTKHKV